MTDEQKIVEFMKIVKVGVAVARYYLNTNNWNLEVAIANYESEHEIIASTSNKNSNEEQTKAATFKDIDIDAEHQKVESEACCTAGAENAGQQILAAKRHEHMSDSTPALTTIGSDRSLHTWGHGVRLGSAVQLPMSTNYDTDNAADDCKAVSIDVGMNVSYKIPENSEYSMDDDNELPAQTVVLRLWADGFSIEDGLLRRFDVPENAAFVDTVVKGEFPAELLAYGKQIKINIEDHSKEKYRALVNHDFEGSGYKLGDPETQVNVPATESAHVESNEAEIFTRANLSFDAARPATTVQIRLINGTRLSAQFNLTHTIADVYGYVQSAREEFADRAFVLLTTHPTQELTDESKTLEEAGLCNVLLTLRRN